MNLFLPNKREHIGTAPRVEDVNIKLKFPSFNADSRLSISTLQFRSLSKDSWKIALKKIVYLKDVYRRHNYIYLLRFKVLKWSQLFSFLLNLWAPPLVTIGTCETQGLRETMALLCGLLAVRVRPWVAVAQKRHIPASRSRLAAKMAAPSDS